MDRPRATQKRWIIAGVAAFSAAGLAGGAAMAAATTGVGQPARLVSAVGALSGAPVVAADVPADPSTTTAPAAATTPGQAKGPTRDAVIDGLVADGTLTKEQGDKVKAALDAARPSRPDGPGRAGPGFGPGPGRGGFGGDIIGGLRAASQGVADAIGITPDQLRTELQSGKSLVDVATAHGKTKQDVVDALVKEATSRLNAGVTAGRLTQAQADDLLAKAKTMIDTFVTTPIPMHGPGGFGHGKPGDDQAPPAAPATTTPSTTTN